MKNLLLYAIGVFSVFTSCTEDRLNSFNNSTVPTSNVVELVAFGSAAKPSAKNKGFGLAYYVYVNLENDSVFFQSRIDPLEEPKLISLTGVIPGLAKNDTIVNFLEATRQINNGNITTTNVPNGVLYCGRNFFARNTISKVERFHYFKLYNIDERFRQGTEYLLSMQVNKQLRKANKVINEDSIVAPIVNNKGFNFRLPPVMVKSTINFKN